LDRTTFGKNRAFESTENVVLGLFWSQDLDLKRGPKKGKSGPFFGDRAPFGKNGAPFLGQILAKSASGFCKIFPEKSGKIFSGLRNLVEAQV